MTAHLSVDVMIRMCSNTGCSQPAAAMLLYAGCFSLNIETYTNTSLFSHFQCDASDSFWLLQPVDRTRMLLCSKVRCESKTWDAGYISKPLLQESLHANWNEEKIRHSFQLTGCNSNLQEYINCKAAWRQLMPAGCQGSDDEKYF